MCCGRSMPEISSSCDDVRNIAADGKAVGISCKKRKQDVLNAAVSCSLYVARPTLREETWKLFDELTQFFHLVA